MFVPNNTFFSEVMLIHNSTIDNYNNTNTTHMVNDYGKIPSLRKITYPEEITNYITFEQPKQTACFLDKQVLDLNYPYNKVLSDHDLYYTIQAVKDLNGISYFKVMPYGVSEHKNLSNNKIKILPLPFKDIGFQEIPLTYKIRQIILNMKRKKLGEMSSFNPKQIENYSSLKINVLFENEELVDSFGLDTNIKNEIYDFPHFISIFTKSTFTFLNVKGQLKRALQELNITNETGKGFVFILTTEYLFVAPLVRPYIIYNKEVSMYADPLFYAGIFNFPEIESSWPETIDTKKIEFEFLEVLEKSSSD